MSIFQQSTPEDFAPEQDTVEVEAELESTDEEQFEEQQEQEVESEPEQEEADPQGHSEELLAGKYKTPEDLVKGYKELERRFHAQRQTQQQPQQPVQQDPYAEDPNEIIYRALQENPAAVIDHFVKQALAPIHEERTNQQLASNIGQVAQDFKQLYTDEGQEAYFGKIQEIANDLGNPNLAKNPSPRVLRMAAEELWGKQSVAQVYQQAKQAGRQEAEQARQAKFGLNAPKSTKPKETPKTPEETIADNIVSAGRKGGLFGR